MENQRCEGVREDGGRCRSGIGLMEVGGKLYCLAHDPNRRALAQRARAKGGKTTGKLNKDQWTRSVSDSRALRAPETAADCVEWASWTARAVATGEIDKGTASAINTSLKTFLAAIDKADHEARLNELQAQVKELKGR